MRTAHWKNDSINHPLRLEIPGEKVVIGQFYNTCDSKYHLAEYIPYDSPPRKYLCGDVGNFSGSRSTHSDRNKCKECWSKVSICE